MAIVMVTSRRERWNRSRRLLGKMRSQTARRAAQAEIRYTEWAGWVRVSARHIWVKGPGKMGGKLLSRKLHSVPAGQKEVNSSVGPIVTGESSTPQKLPSADELPACPSHPPYSTTYLVQTHLGKRLYETEAIAEEPNR